jgi:hypothetical protein
MLSSHLPLCSNLNRAVEHLCQQAWPQGFDVSEDAPNSFKSLKSEFQERGRITVYSGNSEDTIFGDATTNHMARAWHDWCHLSLKADFTFAGEAAACELQCRQLIAYLGQKEGEPAANILRAEVLGQIAYYQRHKHYVGHQREFVVQYLENPDVALAGTY